MTKRPRLTAKKLIAALRRAGFEVIRVRGSHHVDHATVKHSVVEFVREQAHTNGIESFWVLLKRGYYGTFHKMSEKHLQRYVKEFAGRHGVRWQDTIDQMREMANGLDGKRLRYRDLVAE